MNGYPERKRSWKIDNNIEYNSETVRHSVVASSGRLIAWVLKHYDRDEKFQKTSAQDDADAALIAAAPELLEACRGLLKKESELKTGDLYLEFREIEAAVKTAEGGHNGSD